MILTLLLATASLTSARAADDPPARRKYVHLTRTEIPAFERAANFGAVYVGQWASYFITQPDAIDRHGSFKNWHDFMFEPHFDRDSFNYNVFGHTVSGTIYFLFYRSRGYSTRAAFTWAALSSLAFEFTVETVTERPSFQDMYQTPVFGTLSGMALERVSNYFHSWDTWPGRFLGYLFNPLGLLPGSEYGFQTVPILGDGVYGTAVSLRF